MLLYLKLLSFGSLKLFPVFAAAVFAEKLSPIEQTDEDIGIIGQNFMTGYRMVFDRENLKLGWSRSNCQDLSDSERMPLTPNSKPPNPLPTTEQQSAPGGLAVAPAVAERTPSKPSAASIQQPSSDFCLVRFLLLLLFLLPLASGL